MSAKKPTVTLSVEKIETNPTAAAPYTTKSVNGSTVTYNRGETVTSQGRLYKCLKTTTQSPLQNKLNWSFTGTTTIYKNSVPPIKPLENQLWLADTGVLYTWYKDVNGFQWVQI